MAEQDPVVVEYDGNENLIGGPYIEASGKVIGNAGTPVEYVRGQLLGRRTSDGAYGEYDAGASDGLEIPRAVSFETISADAATVDGVSLFVWGELQEEGLILPGAAVLDYALRQEMQDNGLFVVENKGV